MRAEVKEGRVALYREFVIGRDQRLSDNPRLLEACQGADALLPVYDLDPSIPLGPHRLAFLLDSLRALQGQLRLLGSNLLLRRQAPLQEDMCHYAAAPTMYDVEDLPVKISELPEVFTTFRKALEQNKTIIRPPIDAPLALPPIPDGVFCPTIPTPQELGHSAMDCDPHSAFPYNTPKWSAGEKSAQNHLVEYLSSGAVDSYKSTRNGLLGTTFSSRLSPWLALGNISARSVATALRKYEHDQDANEGTYWLWFELVWRDFFALRARKYGLTPSVSLAAVRSPEFSSWCSGQTGCNFVDAAMHELVRTGWLSNRMRQIAASYLIHEMQLPWQMGEAWFAMQLIDFDPASNEGNWRYIAGQGADPRGGRPFNIERQQSLYDPEGAYRQRWL